MKKSNILRFISFIMTLIFTISTSFADSYENQINSALEKGLSLNPIDFNKEDTWIFGRLIWLSDSQKSKIEIILSNVDHALAKNPSENRKSMLLYLKNELNSIKNDDKRMDDLSQIIMGLEEFYVDFSFYPEDISKLTYYISEVPKDSLNWKTINGCEFWYKVKTFEKDWINWQTYELITCLESNINRDLFASKDKWTDPLKFELNSD